MLSHNSASCIILKTPFLNFLSPKLCLFTWPACGQPQKSRPHCPGHPPVLLTQMNHWPLPVGIFTPAPPFPMRLLPNTPGFPLHWTSLSQPCHPLEPPFFFFVAKDLSLKISFEKKHAFTISTLSHYSSQQEMGLPFPIALGKVSSDF